MDDYREFVGSTLEEAKEKARDYFNSNQIEYELLPPKLLTMISGRRDIRIKARKKELSDQYLAFKQKSKDLLDKIIKESGFSVSITEATEGDTVRYMITGEDVPVFTEERGKLLDAIQHILVKSTFKEGLGVNIIVDADDIKREREDYIKNLVNKISNTVRKSGRPYVLKPMNPADRRMVHILVKEQGDLTSESIGDGLFKKVQVSKVDPKRTVEKASSQDTENKER
jgi:spoIIIJ-associated protein